LFVIEATGFGAVVQRSIATAGIIVTGHRDRVKIVTSLDTGLPWFVERVMPGDPPRETAAAFEAAVRAFCFEEREYRP
jgi:hypothetical protein